jgi:D-amino-acid dehydrogenase
VGGLRLPGDETGDCFKFTQALAAMAQQLGVRFHHGVSITGLEAGGGEIKAVHTSAGPMQADAYVMAMGSYSPLLLRPLGLRIPVFPVKGYSLTIPITDESGAPQSTVMDETYKVGITRLGQRIRVGGTAELAGYDLRLRAARRAPLEKALGDLFPHGGDLDQATFWCGLRPMTPDGTPVIGATPYRKLYLNTGHGTLGWTMSCGSARVLADIVSGKRPEISLDGLEMTRYG